MRDFVWETLISENVTALMEARGDSKASDYTADIEEEDNEVTNEEEGQPVEAEAEDYSADVDTEDPPPEEGDNPDPDGAEDYTAEDPTSDDTDPDADTPPDEENPDEGTGDETDANDYTDDGSPTDGDGGDNPTDPDNPDGAPGDNPSDPINNEEELDSKIKNLDLHDMFVYMYNRVSDFQVKLDIIQNSSYMVTRIITQVNKNLVNLKTAISDYLVYSFENNSYVRNLYNYNHFLESLRLNMLIMGKIKDLIPDAQNN